MSTLMAQQAYVLIIFLAKICSILLKQIWKIICVFTSDKWNIYSNIQLF